MSFFKKALWPSLQYAALAFNPLAQAFPLFTWCCKKWNSILMCLLIPWATGCFDKWIADLIVYNGCINVLHALSFISSSKLNFKSCILLDMHHRRLKHKLLLWTPWNRSTAGHTWTRIQWYSFCHFCLHTNIANHFIFEIVLFNC